MEEQNYLSFINKNFGKILGGLLGLLVAIIIVLFGFWRGVFVIFCVSLGVYLGARVEKNEGLSLILEKLRFRRERF